jgi:hypothetical protein
MFTTKRMLEERGGLAGRCAYLQTLVQQYQATRVTFGAKGGKASQTGSCLLICLSSLLFSYTFLPDEGKATAASEGEMLQ